MCSARVDFILNILLCVVTRRMTHLPSAVPLSFGLSTGKVTWSHPMIILPQSWRV